MLQGSDKLGIIDIGSNSIRLVIYELTDHSHRIIDEAKESPRLSQRINKDGTMAQADIDLITETLLHFKMLCEASGTKTVKAVATAAIRNAVNSADIVQQLRERTGITVEVLTGEEEAYYGFLGTINSMQVKDAFLIDIGGGSTEVTLILNREPVHSFSFPFGAVNSAKNFALDDGVTDTNGIKRMVEEALNEHPWITSHPGLPLIGVGGTMRTLVKISQRKVKYSLPLAHNYVLSNAEMSTLIDWLASMPSNKRKKVDGLSKDRMDLVVPGGVILQTVNEHAQSSHYLTSGSGLRDGLLNALTRPNQPKINDVLEHGVRNLMSLHPTIHEEHVEHVSRLSSKLFDELADFHNMPAEYRTYLRTAALLYRIGVTVNYHRFSKHTFYMLAHSRLDGLTHREILLSAIIASFKTKNQAEQYYRHHTDILLPSDLEVAEKLGTILLLGIALDRSKTQAIQDLTVEKSAEKLILRLQCEYDPSVELKELESSDKEFEKIWRVKLTATHSFSTH